MFSFSMTKAMSNRGARTGLVACLIGVLSACAVNPTGGVDFVTMSENREIEIGQELHQQIMRENPAYRDAELQEYVSRVGQKMAENSHRPDLEYTFTVIDSPDINAFALPGGFIYINRGLLAYMTTEAQLAAVLGHEIAHVTARHSVQQRAASQTSTVVSTALVLMTGVGALGETSSLLGGALLSGYGREMELEADSLGAQYLYNAGYDPMAMVDVIGVLKNHEDFSKRTSSQAVSYHGVFATHPRNDRRLQEVVGQAGSLSSEQQDETVDPAEFRRIMSGLSLGPSMQISGNSQSRNRYYQNLLSYTMVFPEGWTWAETTTTLNARSPDTEQTLQVEVRRLQQMKDPRLYLEEDMRLTGLQQTEALSQFGLQGYTGVNPASKTRVAVIYYGPRAFVFTGSADDPVLAAIQSFRPIARNERAIANPPRIAYIQSDGSTYAELAQSSRLQEHQEDMLRLLNGDYPIGEPQRGEWIKIVE